MYFLYILNNIPSSEKQRNMYSFNRYFNEPWLYKSKRWTAKYGQQIIKYSCYSKTTLSNTRRILYISGLQHYSQSRRPGILPVGTTSETHSCWQLHSRLMGVSGIVPGKIMEQPGTMRPAALWIVLLQRYSQSHWPHGSWPFHWFAWYNS